MRFIHTADWQIGMKAAHVGAVGQQVREQRLQSARRVIEVAKEHSADFVLVAGDTFENNAVDRVLVQRVADILAGFPGPVYILSGNHDPLSPGSVWEHPAWASHSNLHILRSAAPLEIPGGVLYPCPIVEKHSQRDPTRWIDASGESRIAIGIGHGTVQGLQTDDLDYPIARDAADRARLDYLAIGHWHSYASFPGEGGAARLVYSGTHETTKFGERDSGNVLLVEIERRGDVPRITPIRTGGLYWRIVEHELNEPGDLERLRRSIETLDTADNLRLTLANVRLRGFLYPQDQPELQRLRELLEARFFYGRIDDAALLPPPTNDWLESLPVGLLRDVAEELQKIAGGAADGSAASPAVARRAILELHRVLSEGQA
jgi:DNA repair exonuclease SbcCD nuclease subunit